jgi:hypothetical protein
MLEMFATTDQAELKATLHVCECGLQDIRIFLGLLPTESPCICQSMCSDIFSCTLPISDFVGIQTAVFACARGRTDRQNGFNKRAEVVDNPRLPFLKHFFNYDDLTLVIDERQVPVAARSKA